MTGVKDKMYLVKAMWRGTAVTMRIEAKNEAQALRRAKAQVLRMQGALSCQDIVVLREV